MRVVALSTLLSVGALASPVTNEKNYCEVPSAKSTPAAAAPEPIVLSPVVPPNIDKYSLQHVVPITDKPTNLYFEPKQNNQVGYSAVAKADFNAPSVVIDYCGYAKTVYSNGQLIISFSDLAAYNAAKNQWEDLDNLYIMTHTPGCGNHAKGEHCFFSATKFSYDEATKTITCTGVPKPVAECVDGYEVEFGHGNQGGYYGAGDDTGNETNPIGNGSISNGTPGNGNSSGISDNFTANLSSACVAPVDNKYHLPTACLGPYFDGDLDDAIGYQNGNQSSWASKIPGSIHAIDSDDLLENGNAPQQKRFIKEVVTFVNKKAVAPALEKAKQIGNAARNTVNAVNNVIVPAISNLLTFNIGERTFEFKAPREQKVDKDAPWPNARLLYKGIPGELTKDKKIGTVKGKEAKASVSIESALQVHCVDCGVSGNIKYSGSVKVGNGLIEYIILDTEMSMTASMYAGLSGNISATLPALSVDLVSTPITPFTIPPFIDVGPSLTVGIDMKLKVGLENAKLLAGGTLTWKGTKSRMAYKKGESSGSNWTPDFQPKFEASGELSLGLDFGIPIELLLGVKLASSKKLGFGFAIEARPAVEAKASLEGSISKTGGDPAVKTIGDKDCNFIKTGIDLKFESGVSAKLTEFAKIPLKKFHEPLQKSIHKGCINKTEAGLSYQTLSRRQSNTTVSDNTVSTNDTLWYLDTTQLTNVTLEASANDQVEPFILPAIASTAYNDTNGIEYVSLQDSSEELFLTSCGNGNLYMQLDKNLTSLSAKGCGTLFAYDAESDIIYSDGAAQLFYYYPEEMSATGVSRLRHSAIESVPSKAEYIFFEPNMPVDDGSAGDLPSDPVWVAKSTDASYFATTVCLFADPTLPAKVFLVEDLEKGVEMLKSPDIKYSITGGEVTECFYLPLTQGNDEPDSAWNGIADNLDWEEDWVENWELEDEFLDAVSELSNEEIDAFLDSL